MASTYHFFQSYFRGLVDNSRGVVTRCRRTIIHRLLSCYYPCCPYYLTVIIKQKYYLTTQTQRWLREFRWDTQNVAVENRWRRVSSFYY